MRCEDEDVPADFCVTRVSDCVCLFTYVHRDLRIIYYYYFSISRRFFSQGTAKATNFGSAS